MTVRQTEQYFQILLSRTGEDVLKAELTLAEHALWRLLLRFRNPHRQRLMQDMSRKWAVFKEIA